MLRTSRPNPEIDKPVAVELGGRSVVAEPEFDPRANRASSDSAFAHAVLQLATLSLSARSVLALRG